MIIILVKSFQRIKLYKISKRMTEDTITILSGIIKERQNEVLTSLGSHSLDVIHEEYVDEWVALAIRKKRSIL